MEARTIVRRLISLAAEVGRHIGEQSPYARNESMDRPERENLDEDDRYSSQAKRLLRDLEIALAEENWQPQPPELELAVGQEWHFGQREDLIARPVRILRGYIQPVKSRPLLLSVSLKVVCFLMTVERGKDYLLRESGGGIGWHYHYLDWKKRRSDVVVCWDTRWTDDPNKKSLKGGRGLFVEPHAVRWAEFTARRDRWGDEKRAIMYLVCSDDLKTRDISEYRCASNNSEAVYPFTATLTPRPATTSAAGKKKK